MKKRLIGAGIAGGILALTLATQAKEPVIMKVNGQEVPLSEFEYLYHKNKQQQAALQPLDEYAEIFKIYKLKVADALAMGLDTTAAFRNDYEQYRKELAQPYLTDSTYINQLAKEAYDRYNVQIHTGHIMIRKTPTGEGNRRVVARLDSIRKVIIEKKGDFSTLAKQYSEDHGSAHLDGELGWLSSPQLPYAFTNAIYSLKPGEISEVVESPIAFHIITVYGRRPNIGALSASHIVKLLPPNATEEQWDAARASLDSIYNIVKDAPDKFEEMAVRYSDDKNSGMRGGLLQPFEQGAMPEAFDSAAFAMADGGISAPIRTEFGWHLIKRFSLRPIPSYEQLYPQLVAIVTNPRDLRGQLIKDNLLAQLSKEFKVKPVKKNLGAIDKYIATNGIDSLFLTNIAAKIGSNAPLYTFGKESLTLDELTPSFQGYKNSDHIFAARQFELRTNALLRQRLMTLKEQTLEQTEPDYRNLLHEFRDGSLLFEAGRQKVWDRAVTDTAGLNAFFQQHRADYAWQEPRLKGYLIQATNDSVAQAVKTRLVTLKPAEYLTEIRKEFGSAVQIDKILIAKGTNPMVDYLAFGGPEVKPSNANYNTFFLYDFKTLTAPEEVADVRGLVTADYQNQLEADWVQEIKGKYPVEVYEKVLRKVKER